MCMFESIYNLKKRILQLERLRYGTKFSDEQFKNFRTIYGEAKTVEELENQIAEFTTSFISTFIPDDIKELWKYCDYTVYTDANHHRKFWNEIENDVSVQYFLDKYFELIGIETSESDKMNFFLSIYDFNNYEVYFEDKDDMMEFFHEYGPEPCTCFEKENGSFVETWSA